MRRCRGYLYVVVFLLLVILVQSQTATEDQEAAAQALDSEEVLDLDQQETTEQQTRNEESSNSASETTTESTANKQDTNVVYTYLEQLSDAELEKICVDRGLAIDTDKALTRGDYLAAAQQCISLEDDINAILNENPDLAAELDTEIERMRTSKEKLERERDALLKETEMLQEQLRQAGVELEEYKQTGKSASRKSSGGTSSAVSGEKWSDRLQPKDGEKQTALQVFQLSLVLLYERVRQDVEFVIRVMKPVLEPMGQGLKMVWRYSKPTLESVFAKVIVKAKELKVKVEAKIAASKETKAAAAVQDAIST